VIFEPTYSRAAAGNGNPSPQADPVLNAWQTWNVLDGMVYSLIDAGPGSAAETFAQYELNHPTATIVNDNGQGIGGIRLTSGFVGALQTQNTYVDAFTIGTAAGTTTYDFWPNSTSVPDAGATAMLLGFALAGLSAFRRWKIAS
jgi:hypothetical protein